MTTKILALVDTLGSLVGFRLLPGQRHDICGVEPLIRDREFGALLADKAFEAGWPEKYAGSYKAIVNVVKSQIKYFEVVEQFP